ncbi:MAG: methyl-accepting chemotaxis protein [Methylobacterium sp.]|nr:methyl-accepting chemotaxis protein [Methylobacterium sp.]
MIAGIRGKSLIVNQIAVLVVLFMLTGIGFHALQAMKLSADQMVQGKDVVADILPPPLYLIEANLISYELLISEPASRPPLIDKLNSLKKEYDTRNRFWDTSDLDPALKASLMGKQRESADRFWKEAQERFIPAVQAGDMTAAENSARMMRTHYAEHRTGVDVTVSVAAKYADDKLLALTASGKSGYWQLGISALLGFLLVTALAVPTINRIYRSLRDAGEAAAAIAAGDLSHPMPPAGKDEVGELVSKLSQMRSNLHELVSAAHINVEAVTRSASELSASASNSATASQIQSEAASGMAAAMEQLSVSIDQVEENAREAREFTLASGLKSEEGGKIIHNAAQEMRLIADTVNVTANTIRELEDLSGQISNIVKVIKEIADQTNLLALNAAIEAARAGEQGRGFAVVADEVRQLAERTSSATKEISEMIAKTQQGTQRAVTVMEAGVRRVNEGVDLANKAGDSVTGIRAGSERVTHAVDEISNALREQVSAAREIARQVELIAQGAEQNNTTAAQTESSAHHLEELAQRLNTVAGRFRVG